VSLSPSVALVTGVTGLVGSHIAERLLADGWSVRALTRDPEHARGVLPPGVEAMSGDVLDEASFARAADGVHVVFHAAANVLARGGWDGYRVTNVEGTRLAIAATERARARLLHVSSVAVYGPSARYDALRRGQRTTEATVLAPLPEHAYYARSKRESEALVLRAHREGRIWATSVRPCVVYGRRDRQFVPRMARLVRGGVIPLLRRGQTVMPIVHAENVAHGAVRAATSDIAGGKAYNLTNDGDVTVRRFFELAGEGLGRRPVFVPMPVSAARGILRGAKWITRVLLGSRFSLLSNSTIDFVAEHNPFCSDLAARELGWSPIIEPRLGIPDAFRWWKQSWQESKNGRDVAPVGA
jgi:nucleoside-diphosphate-sugar epimerase